MTPAETLAKVKQLDRFLGKAVTEIKASDRTTMNKFAELASRSAEIRKSIEDRADRLATRLDALPALADATLGKHEKLLDEEEQGIKLLEEALSGMIGHNGAPPLQDSPPVLPPPVPVIEPPAAETAPAVEPPAPVMDATATGNPPA